MANPTVLVIDDEAGPRNSLRMILMNDYEVILADGAVSGLRLAKQHAPDVVFLDIKMPEMDGTEVLRRLKDIDAELEVVLITAYAALDTAQQAVRHGAIDYITKPFAVDEITAVAERAITKRIERQKEQELLRQVRPAADAISWQLRALDDTAEDADQSAMYENLAAAHNSIEAQLSKVARLNAIGEIAAEVAHDVRNFLTAILLRIEMLLMDLKQSSQISTRTVQDALEDIVRAAQDGTRAVERIAGISEADPYAPVELVEVNDIVADVVSMGIGGHKQSNGTAVSIEALDVPPVFASGAALRTAVLNIVINARQALTDGGQVTIRTDTDGNNVIIQVEDSGVGIPAELMDRVTEAFFTTKGDDGSGLGLSVARKVISRHNGTLDISSEVGVGTTVTIRLPMADEAAIAAASGTADEEAIAAETQEVAQRAVGSATFRVPDVLVVDDDVEVLSSLKAMLIGAGLTVEGVADASIGLSKFVGYLEEADRAPGVVVTDLRLPGLLGTDMAQRVKEMSPYTRVVLVSAYVDEHTDLVNCPYLDAVLRKPFQLAELLKEVGSARV
jgi:signal transduction histidine kinase